MQTCGGICDRAHSIAWGRVRACISNPFPTDTSAHSRLHALCSALHATAACRDGAVRIMMAGSGQVVGGFHSYYGAMLCCSFSHDGRCVLVLRSLLGAAAAAHA